MRVEKCFILFLQVVLFYGIVARVEVTQLFANTGSNPIEVVFTFPIPKGKGK